MRGVRAWCESLHLYILVCAFIYGVYKIHESLIAARLKYYTYPIGDPRPLASTPGGGANLRTFAMLGGGV